MKKGIKIILLLGDGVIFYTALFATLIIRYGAISPELWVLHLAPFTVIFALWIIALYIDDLYELSFGQRPTELLVRLARVSVIVGALAVVFFYFGSGRLFTITPQRVLLAIMVLTMIGLYLWRLCISLIARSPHISNGVLLIGSNELTGEILTTIKRNVHLGLHVAGVIPTKDTPIESIDSTLILQQDFQNLKNLCINKKIGIIVSTIHPRENPQLLENLFDCIPLKIHFFDATTFYEKITGKIPVAVIEHIWFLENLAENKKSFYERTKRIEDILLGFVILAASLPLFPFIIAAIKLSSRGPVFFYQKRVGKNDDIFSMVKFRTMVTTAEAHGPQWAVKNDHRITAVGKFLRKTRLDEIPQLWNVLRGNMSLIGPRPERPEFVDELQQTIPFYKQRLLVKPGLTGWAQVMGPTYGGSKDGSLEKLQYDLFYIKNRSLSLDLSITLKTIRTILSLKGQ